jgi:integrase
MEVSLKAVIDMVEADGDLRKNRKVALRSAVKRTMALVGNGAADLVIDPRDLRRRLERLSPAQAGLSPASLRNLTSLTWKALKLALPQLAPQRDTTPLAGEWREVAQQLPTRLARPLSRFMRLASRQGWRVAEIGEAHFEHLGAQLEEKLTLTRPELLVRRARLAWNEAAASVPDWTGNPVEAPRRRPAGYWVEPGRWHPDLREEVQRHLTPPSDGDQLFGDGKPGLKPSTIKRQENLVITAVSALVQCGVPPDEITSLAELLHPDNVDRWMRFLHARAGNRINHPMHRLGYLVPELAKRAGLPEATVERLHLMLAKCRKAAPSGLGMTAKNKAVVGHLDDPAFVRRLVDFPRQLQREAERARGRRDAASYARDAIAVELLLTCALRIGNLIRLRLGETLIRQGERWVIDIPGSEVKNGQPLRFPLLPDSAALLEWYLATWHCHWCGGTSILLLPNHRGGSIFYNQLSASIARRAERLVGARITAHQFRHLAARLMLRAEPNAIGVVSQHLGHRTLDTTQRYYAGTETEAAAARYHEVLNRHRAAAAPASARRRGGRSRAA